MHNSCGRAVHSLLIPGGKSVGYTTTLLSTTTACAQAYSVVNSLYYKCTQVIHRSFCDFSSVNFGLYPLSTQPIKTTTF